MIYQFPFGVIISYSSTMQRMQIFVDLNKENYVNKKKTQNK